MNKKRSPNFAASEIKLLVSLVAKYKSVIENKQSGKSNVDVKAAKWKDIEAEFNSTSGTIFRSVDVLRKKYENLKKRTKERAAEEKKFLYGTGGGPPKSPKSKDDVDEIMKQVIGPQIDGLGSVYDSDVLNESTVFESSAQNVLDERIHACSEEIMLAEPLVVEENQKEFKKQSEQLATINKDKFVFGTRKSKILNVSKRKLCADKWQELADQKIELVREKIKKTKMESEFAKEKHDLELKYMKEEHELKCATLRSSTAWK